MKAPHRHVVAVIICLPLTILSFGCMSSSSPTRVVATITPGVAGATVDTGHLVIGAHAFQDVYYGAPFVATPKLDVPDHWGRCQVVMQTPTRFRVLNNTGSDLEIDWKATGTKGAPASLAAVPQTRELARPTAAPAIQPASATIQPVSAQGDGLPAEPVPVSGSRQD
jgi:hypothetical protein